MLEENVHTTRNKLNVKVRMDWLSSILSTIPIIFWRRGRRTLMASSNALSSKRGPHTKAPKFSKLHTMDSRVGLTNVWSNIRKPSRIISRSRGYKPIEKNLCMHIFSCPRRSCFSFSISSPSDLKMKSESEKNGDDRFWSTPVKQRHLTLHQFKAYM